MPPQGGNRCKTAGVLLPFVLLAGQAWAEQVNLVPANSAVQLRSYGFGLFPLDGQFTRFHGLMQYDPAHPGSCQVMLEIEAGSLAMSSESVRDRIVGPNMMDVARFPDLSFHGACQGAAVVGDLTMHGETHPVSLDYVSAKGSVTATGRLRRSEWGITGSPLLGGSEIRIRVVLPDPFNGRHA